MSSTVETCINSLHKSGAGLGEVRDKRLLLPGTLPGERVEARILGGGQRQMYGEVVRWITTSPHRVDPSCSVANECGGCSIQHMSVAYQHEVKIGRLRKFLDQQKLKYVEIKPSPGLFQTEGFRSKAQFMVVPDERGVKRLGLYASHSNHLVPLEHCMVQDALIQGLMKPLSIRISREKGLEQLRGILIKSNGDEALLTWLMRRHPSKSELLRLAKLSSGLQGIVGAFFNVSPPQGNALLGSVTTFLWGEKRLTYSLLDIQLQAGPVSFMQTTLEGAELLLEEVRSRAPEKIEHLVDLYGGTGLFCKALAGRSSKATMVERDGPSAEDGKLNLKDVAQVLVGDVAHMLERIGDVDVLVVDPPRSGCSPEVIHRILEQWRPRVLVYVSCLPRTLARDLHLLSAGGYRVETVTPVDLFPHTSHLEVVTHMTRTV